DAPHRSEDRPAFQRRYETLFPRHAQASGKPSSEPSRLARRLASGGGAVHYSSWRILLSVCFFRPLLPWEQEQLQNHGEPIEKCDWALRRCAGYTDVAGRWNTAARGKQSLDRAWRRIALSRKRW